MNIFKNKLLLLAPIISLIIVFIFAVAQIPSTKQAPKNLPITIVNEDKGVDIPNKGHLNMGKTIVENIEKQSKATTGDDEPAIKWTLVSNEEKAKKEMDNQEYYGALVIPKGFSEKLASLQIPKPASPEIRIYVNQGMNAIASNTVTKMLNGIVDGINKNASAQLLAGLEKQGDTLTTKQATILASPITKKVINVHQTGSQGNAPGSFFQPLWIASLIGAVVIWTAMRKSEQSIGIRKKKLVAKSSQVLIGAVLAIVAGFGLAWIEEGMLGFDIPRFIDTAFFLTITIFSFVLMILAVLSWVGFAGVPIFALLLFFGMPLLTMPPEFMPSFYQDWVYPWLPMRFLIDGLRDLFFFSKELSWNTPTSALVWIGLGSLVVVFLSILKPSTEKEKATAKDV